MSLLRRVGFEPTAQSPHWSFAVSTHYKAHFYTFALPLSYLRHYFYKAHNILHYSLVQRLFRSRHAKRNIAHSSSNFRLLYEPFTSKQDAEKSIITIPTFHLLRLLPASFSFETQRKNYAHTLHFICKKIFSCCVRLM